MIKKILALFVTMVLILSGLTSCTANEIQNGEKAELDVQKMNEEMINAAKHLPKSELFYCDNLEITGLGVNYDGRPTDYDGCYYFPAIEAMTGVKVNIDWHTSDGYSSTVATTLLMGKDNLPDIR